ncbi:MAG: UDP-2,3-diacylglucosamine diphosphatase [Burkholderiales bacterium]|nr:UDP-2,3-diacylglucosamine diphosphatase [Burkholderiales bacterium]
MPGGAASGAGDLSRAGEAAAAAAAAGANPAELAAPVPLQAPREWRAIDFISDLHLSELMPATFAAFAAHLQHTEADAVFILGDLFELWVGDDARREPFAQRCVRALAEAAQKRSVAIMGGNRDFLMGAELLADCGARALPDPTLLMAFGQRVLLTHGDALCLADHAYQAFRRQVRQAAWLRAFLARPLAERLALAREIRKASDTRRQFDGEGSADVDASAAVALLRESAAPTLVHGHTHRPGTEAWAGGFVRHVLTDWDLDAGTRAEVLRLTPAGFSRVPPARTC